MQTSYYTTAPPPLPTTVEPLSAGPRLTWKHVFQIVTAVAIITFWILPTSMDEQARSTLVVFACAIWFWIFSSVPDTYVALVAAAAVVLMGIITVEEMFAPLGHDTTWLLIGAFILSGAISASGLAHRAAIHLSVGVTNPHLFVHILALATVLTAFAVPATSGRAALILPVFLTLSEVLPQWLRRILAIALPSVILFSAVASLIGAGAHLITNQVLAGSGHPEFSFTRWVLLGLPYALVVSHVAMEILFRRFSSPAQRNEELRITREALTSSHPINNRLSQHEVMTLSILGVAVILWFSENIHGIPPALVAVLAALVATSPALKLHDFGDSIKKVPWNLLLFMAATVALAQALVDSGAASMLADSVFRNLPGWLFVLVVIVVSTLAHLIIQSRSARSAVLIPVIIAVAPTVGVNPVAAAFISTAAAGFCHTLPASAKPLTIFRGEDDDPRYSTSDLLTASAVMVVPFMAITTLFAFFIWPLMGLPLFS